MKYLFKRLRLKIYYALKGLAYVGRRELSFQLEIILGLALLVYAYYVAWPLWKYLVLIGLLVVVLFAEIINTVLERLLDLVEPRLSSRVAVLKDILAGAVLWLVFGFVLVAVILSMI